MRVLGVDFTSRPSRRKPIVLSDARLAGDRLHVAALRRLTSLAELTSVVERAAAPLVVGLDFPFGLPLPFLVSVGWPREWDAYVDRVGSLGREEYVAAIRRWQAEQPAGSKEPRRRTDRLANARSPLKLGYPAVGRMFALGAPWLAERVRRGGVVLPFHDARPKRPLYVEAYPALVVRHLLAGERAPYKDSTRGRTASEVTATRERLVAGLDAGLRDRFGVRLTLAADVSVACREDDTGDSLDAVLAAVLAAWSWLRRDARPEPFGMPQTEQARVEGWIVGCEESADGNLPA